MPAGCASDRLCKAGPDGQADGDKRQSVTMADGMAVENNGRAQRYELRRDGELSVLEYERSGDHITFTHTKVPKAVEGRGIGSELVRVALEDARAGTLTVVPACPFVRAYIREHPEYVSLVDPVERQRVEESPPPK